MADGNQQLTGVDRDRQILAEAQAKGPAATLGAFVRLSGPGWLQSAITLGGGSLAGALFLGILGGPSMLWLQLLAITMGVVMLSAIGYVTLTTGQRPFKMINDHINPVLGWGWLIATSMANMIWCMPQFSLCYEALEKNLAPNAIASVGGSQYIVSAVLLVLASIVLAFNVRRGAAAKVFDLFLKALIAMIVLCFFGVVILLATNGSLEWGAILRGFFPDFSQWWAPAGEMRGMLAETSDEVRRFWESKLVTNQRGVMIAAAATAVGINMTFLMPYSMLQRGWNKTFRGLARFDLATGMAIPYILVTSCVVIAAGQAFHAKPDQAFLSTDVAEFETSPLTPKIRATLLERVDPKAAEAGFDSLTDTQKQEALAAMAALPEVEKRAAASLVQRSAFELSQALAPLLGEDRARVVFGLGIFGMGFSTIIILMLINGFVFCEALNKPREGNLFVTGCAVAGIVGALWPVVWDGDSKIWLAILASSFGMMLLPIAYITFFMLMNSKTVLGEDRPKGASRVVWNTLMILSVLGALVAAGTAIYDTVNDDSSASREMAGNVVLVVLVVYVIAVAAGFFFRKGSLAEVSSTGK